MLEITRKNCYKCDLETIMDPNDSQYFWINRRDWEAESQSNWRIIFDKYGDSSTKTELTPNCGKFQSNRIFVKNDLFERLIENR